MPKSWTPEEVRNWILKTLYDIYMNSPVALVSFGRNRIGAATEEHPSWNDIYKECEWLKWKGFIEANFGPESVSGVKLTPAGREYVERNSPAPHSAQKPS